MYVYKQRCDVLPDTLWCSTTGVHACGVRSEYDKNIARFVDKQETPSSGLVCVSKNPCHKSVSA